MRNRVIYGAILIAVMLICVFLSPVTRMLFFALAGAVCAYEYSKRMEEYGIRCSYVVMVSYLVAQAVLVLLRAGTAAYFALFVAAVYASMFLGIVRKKSGGKGAIDTVAGLTYPCMLFGVMMMIAASDIWLETLSIACLATWSCDAAALIGGKRFGRHKLAPRISPKKTVEGSVIGAAASAVAGAVVYLLGIWLADAAWIGDLYEPLPLWVCISSAVISSTMGQIGDLAESLLKRMLKIKDFSNLIPGHGGMFDRADSLLFSVPTAYFLLRLAQLIIK